ncbi:hypothetical protein V8J88_13255 [Massilia sp. W12]|uniref:hypothetical protein n=1 Tax=Massilia sp. W12 TaxID=3126507 RepID=UPI0030CE644E
MNKNKQNTAFLLRNKKTQKDATEKKSEIDWRAAAIKGERLLKSPTLYKKSEFTEWE